MQWSKLKVETFSTPTQSRGIGSFLIYSEGIISQSDLLGQLQSQGVSANSSSLGSPEQQEMVKQDNKHPWGKRSLSNSEPREILPQAGGKGHVSYTTGLSTMQPRFGFLEPPLAQGSYVWMATNLSEKQFQDETSTQAGLSP